MKDQILVSVVMPTYNDAPYLREAIDSVLNQTFSDFEFIIVNDESTDETASILNGFDDKRMRIIYLDQNRGTAHARNIGMAKAQGAYIAIFDSDDIMDKERLQTQFKYLEANPGVDFLGSAAIKFDVNSRSTVYFPKSSHYIKSALFFKNILMQPSIMFRKKKLNELNLSYDTKYPIGEDYHLFYHAAKNNCNFSNLREILTLYRLSPEQLSSADGLEKNDNFLKEFFKERMSDMELRFNDAENDLLYHFIKTRIPINQADYSTLSRLLKTIQEKNQVRNIYEKVSFAAALLFYKLRLIKYRFWNGADRSLFFIYFLKLMITTNPAALRLFWKNEGRILFRKKKYFRF